MIKYNFLLQLILVAFLYFKGNSNSFLLFFTISNFIQVYLFIDSNCRNECASRVYSGPLINSFVCVCNSTYCDTIDGVDFENKETLYQEFVTSKKEFRLDKSKLKFNSNKSESTHLYLFFINKLSKFSLAFYSFKAAL